MNQELNVLYIVLSVGFAVLVLFASFALYRLTVVLREMEQTLSRINKIVDNVDSAVSTVVPAITGISAIIGGIGGYLREIVAGKSHTRADSKSSKSS